jgi:hypothetical protein
MNDQYEDVCCLLIDIDFEYPSTRNKKDYFDTKQIDLPEEV